MARQEQASTLVNRVAVEIGLVPTPAADPFSSTNEAFSLLIGLLNAAGQELVTLRDWNELTFNFTFNTTTDVTSGKAALPDDYDRFIPQTGWDLSEELPVAGPLTAQQWNYLIGRQLASDTIYVCFRINQSEIEIFPDPPPADRDISFSYVSRNWAKSSGGTSKDYVEAADDVVLYDPILMQKFLKAKYLIAKGLPTAADAKIEFDTILQNRFGQNKGAQVLNSGGLRRNRLISAGYNLPDTGYGV